jgi:hypothetical protein
MTARTRLLSVLQLIVPTSCPTLRHLGLFWSKCGNATLLAIAGHSALRRVVIFERLTFQKLETIHVRRAQLELRPVTIDRF